MSILFESFMVFYLIEILFLIYIILYFYYEPKQPNKKIWDPLGLEKIKEKEDGKKYRRKSR